MPSRGKTTRRKASKSGKKSRKSETLDVKSMLGVAQLEKMIKKLSVVLVFVYADWCPHCHTYRREVWSKLKAMKKRGVGLAAVNETVFSRSPVKHAKINGYPSVLLIGKDGKLGEFKDETGSPTNALPNARDMAMMSGIVKGSAAETNYAEPQNVDEVPVSNATLPQEPVEPGTKLSLGEASETPTGMESDSSSDSDETNASAVEANTAAAESNASAAESNASAAESNASAAESNASAAESNASAAEPNMSAPDHIEAESSPSLETPSMDESRSLSKEPEESADSSAVLLESLKKPATTSPSNLLPPEPELEIKPKDRDSSQLGGSLYMALLEAAKATAPAAILAASASAISRRTKKFRGKRKQTRASRRR